MKALPVGNAKQNQSVLPSVLGITALALGIYYVACFLYGVMFGVFSWPALQAFLNSGGLPSAINDLGLDAQQIAVMIIGLTAVPMGYALMTAIFPFIGAWIYLGTPDAKTTSVGLGVAACFTISNVCIYFILHPETLQALANPTTILGLSIGFLIAALFVFLLMGIGFNLAKILKLKPKPDGIDLSSL